MRVCNHGCNVTLSVSPAHFKAVSLTLKYKYYGIQMKNTFSSFDLEIDHLFSSEPRKESERKKNNRRPPRRGVSEDKKNMQQNT